MPPHRFGIASFSWPARVCEARWPVAISRGGRLWPSSRPPWSRAWALSARGLTGPAGGQAGQRNRRRKYVCPGCEQVIRAATSTLAVVCGACGVPFERADRPFPERWRVHGQHPRARREEVSHLPTAGLVARDLVARAHPKYPRWAEQLAATGCRARPVRLAGRVEQVDVASGEICQVNSTDREPDGSC
jgi:hypothetical protein